MAYPQNRAESSDHYKNFRSASEDPGVSQAMTSPYTYVQSLAVTPMISGEPAYPEAMKPLSCGKENNGGYKVLISSRVGGPFAAMD